MEKEIKFKIRGIRKLSARLIKLGAKQFPKAKEIDYTFDTLDNSLSHQAKLLHLRKIQDTVFLSLKAPSVDLRSKKSEEINIKLFTQRGFNPSRNDFKTVWLLFHQIGFIGYFNKEKIRRRFRYKNMDVFLDRLPFLGYYLEIVGKDRDIFTLIKKLDLDRNEALKESYNQLFNLFCIVNKNRLKQFKKKLKFSFKCEKEFKKSFT